MAFLSDKLAISAMPIAIEPIATNITEIKNTDLQNDNSEEPLTYEPIKSRYNRPEIYIDEGPEVEAIKARKREKQEFKRGGVPVEWQEL